MYLQTGNSFPSPIYARLCTYVSLLAFFLPPSTVLHVHVLSSLHIILHTVLSALIDRIARERNVIAIDGSLYSHHPSMHKLMMDVISELSPGKSFDIINAKDGSGMGAGLAAAVLSHAD